MIIFLIIWIKKQIPSSVAKTLVPFGSQEPSLKLTLIGIIADSTEWQGRLAEEAPCIPRNACQLMQGWGNSGNPTLSLPLSFMLCEDKGRQDFWSTTSSKHCLQSLPLHITSLPKLNWWVGIQRQWKPGSDQWSTHGRCWEAHGSTHSVFGCYDRSSRLWCYWSPCSRMHFPAQEALRTWVTGIFLGSTEAP